MLMDKPNQRVHLQTNSVVLWLQPPSDLIELTNVIICQVIVTISRSIMILIFVIFV